MVGSAIVRNLQDKGFSKLLLKARDELDLRDQAAVHDFFKKEKPEYVFLAAAKVGGIHANNTYQADFLYENLVIETNVLHAALIHEAEKVLFLGSSCIYPKLAPQPILEESLLTGPLEPTNEGYAIAKIAGLKLCEYFSKQHRRRFVSAMPTNLYGVNDNFHPENSHVVPALMGRFHRAKTGKEPAVSIWGTGTPLRDLLNVDDLAEALYVIMEKYEDTQTINIGTGKDHSILDLASKVKKAVGFLGEIKTDPSRPDGTPRKILDSKKILGLGWKPRINLDQGLSETYQWALKNNIFA